MPCSSPFNLSRLPPAESLRNLACTIPGGLQVPTDLLSVEEAEIKFVPDPVETILKALAPFELGIGWLRKPTPF